MLVTVLIVLLIVAVFLYLFNTYVTLDPPIKNIINLVVIIIALIYVLRVLGLV